MADSFERDGPREVPLNIIISGDMAGMSDSAYSKFMKDLKGLIERNGRLRLEEHGRVTRTSKYGVVPRPNIPTSEAYDNDGVSYSVEDLVDYIGEDNRTRANDLWRWLVNAAGDKEVAIDEAALTYTPITEDLSHIANFPLNIGGDRSSPSIEHDSLVGTALWLREGLDSNKTFLNPLLTKDFFSFVNNVCAQDLVEPLTMPMSVRL
jgi:hypothetical protein